MAKRARAAKVVSIENGEPVSLPGGKPDKDLVETLFGLLEEAQAGKIIGVAAVVVYPATVGYTVTAGPVWAGTVVSYPSIGVLEDLKYMFLKDLNS